VALARALYAEAEVLLLDDVLSAVDAQVGAFLFFETFSKHLKGKTLLLVTHSLNYVQHTDRILILDDCALVASGTFQELKQHLILQQVATAFQKKIENRNPGIVQSNKEIVKYDVEAAEDLF
jgi:ABC-type multidrug transport system fused ATPase/permease subunit